MTILFPVSGTRGWLRRWDGWARPSSTAASPPSSPSSSSPPQTPTSSSPSSRYSSSYACSASTTASSSSPSSSPWWVLLRRTRGGRRSASTARKWRWLSWAWTLISVSTLCSRAVWSLFNRIVLPTQLTAIKTQSQLDRRSRGNQFQIILWRYCPVAEFIDTWLGDNVNSGIVVVPTHVDWWAGTTTLSRSWLYLPSQDLWIQLLPC